MGTERSDAELVALWREHVMGWKLVSKGRMWDLGDGFQVGINVPSEFVSALGFNPLDSDTDAWAGVDAHREEWVVTVDNDDFDEWRVHIFKSPDEGFEARAPDRRRALVLACLRAVGEDV